MSAPAPRRRLRRGVPAALLALIALLVGGLVSPAFAAQGLAGTVVAGTGGTLAGASAQVGTRSGTTFTQLGSASDASDGSYAFSGLPAGNYVVRLTSTDFRTAYVPASGTTATTDIAQAKVFAVDGAAGTDLATGSTTLSTLKQGTVTGTVENEAGQPVQGAVVRLVRDGADPVTTTSAMDGTYALAVRPGTYTLQALLPGSGYDQFSASGIAVAEGDTLARDVVLVAFNVLSGSVAVPDGPDADTDPDPVQGVAVTIERRTTTPSGDVYEEVPGPRALSLANGTFRMAAPIGDFVVGFVAQGLTTSYVLSTPGNGADTVTTPDKARAMVVPVRTGTTTLARAVLGSTASIAGRITTTGGVPIEGVNVALQRRQATANGGDQIVTVTQALTGADGTYRFPTVTAGTYKLFASAAAYADRYFPTSSTFDGGADVVVAAGQELTGRDIVLAGNGTIVNLEKPWISGANQAGATLTANTGRWAPDPSGFRYQWFNGANPIQGATSRTYDIDLFTSGGRYSVAVTALSPDRNDLTVRSAQTGAASTALQTPAFENRQVPTISGTPAVGQVLTVSNGQWSSTPSAFAYQWFANGTAITGATEKTFTPTVDQLAQQLTARVTATSGTSTAASTSEPTAAVARGTLVNTAAPVITGSPVVGQELTATPGTWSVDGLSFTYQWLADGAPITGATAATFTPAAQQAGKRLSVRVTAAKAGFDPASATSAMTAPVGDTTVSNVSRPTISGTPAVGSTLTASPGTWNPSTGVTFTYQWLADGAPIAGATGTSYSPAAAVVGKRLSVRVTGAAPGRTEGTATSLETAVVSAGTQPPTVTGGPGIIGSPRLDQTLVVERGTVSPSTTTVTVQWLRDGEDIAGATGSSYQVRAADLGRTVGARVTYTSTGGVTVRTVTAGIAKSVADIAAVARQGDVATRLRVTVAADQVDDLRGLVRVLEGRRELGRISLVDGRGSLLLRDLDPGRTVLTLVYRQEPRTTADRERLVVRVQR